MSTINATVNKIIAEVSNGQLDHEAIKAQDQLKEELALSSLQYIVMALKLEEEYGAPIITAENIGEMNQVSDIYERIETVVNQG